MNDQRTARPPSAATSHYQLTTAALWIGLLAGAACNAGLQALGLWFLAFPFGLIAAVSGVALIVRAVAGRRR